MKETGGASDITIGDFWGVERIAPNIDNTAGVSLALVHTEKGKQLFEHIQTKIDSIKVDYLKAAVSNSVLNHSVKRPNERDIFYSDLKTLKWKTLKHKYADDGLMVFTKRKLAGSLINKFRRRLLYKDHKGRRNGNAFQYGLLVVFEKKAEKNICL